MDAGRGLDARVAHLVMGQKVTWLRNWSTRREPWLLDGAEIADSVRHPSQGWIRGVTDDNWEMYHHGGKLVPRYSTDMSQAWLVVQEMRRRKWTFRLGPAQSDNIWLDTERWDAIFARVGRADWARDIEGAERAICLAAIAAITAKGEDERQEADNDSG